MRRAIYWRDPKKKYAFVRIGTVYTKLDGKLTIIVGDDLYTFTQDLGEKR